MSDKIHAKVVTCEPHDLDRVVEENQAEWRLVGMAKSRGVRANGETWPTVKLVYERREVAK
jgi:hypothetical protein